MTDSKGSDTPVQQGNETVSAENSGSAKGPARSSRSPKSRSDTGKNKAASKAASSETSKQDGEAKKSKAAKPARASTKSEAPGSDQKTPAGRSASGRSSRRKTPAKSTDAAKTAPESASDASMDASIGAATPSQGMETAANDVATSIAAKAHNPAPSAVPPTISENIESSTGKESGSDSKGGDNKTASSKPRGRRPGGRPRASGGGKAGASADSQSPALEDSQSPIPQLPQANQANLSQKDENEVQGQNTSRHSRSAQEATEAQVAVPKDADAKPARTSSRRGSGRKTSAPSKKGAANATGKAPMQTAPTAESGAEGTAEQIPSGAMPSEDLRPEIAVLSEEIERIQISPSALVPSISGLPETIASAETANQQAPAFETFAETPSTESPSLHAENGDQYDMDGQDLADFPTSFGDASAEDAFEDLESSEEGSEGETTGKKRRSRGRRGRGRKKAAVLAAEQETAAADLPDAEPESEELAAPEPKGAQKKGRGKSAETAESLDEAKAGRRKMFVSVLPEEQVEVVITEEGQVLEYYVEMLHQAKTKGNIYKGIIHNVDPNLQAAFVSYGSVKNGFLQIDEVHPEYYNVAHEAEKGRKYPPIQKVLKPGQEVLVQVVKEPAGTKGAFLTTYLSIPGRFLVLTPGREQIGVSRKVENEKERARLRELLEGLSPGPGLGVIVRTVSMGASKTNLQRDLQFLKRTWKEVRTRGTSDKAPCLIYQEQDLTARAIRDYLTESIGEVWVDDEKTADEVTEIAVALFPRKQNLVRMHKEDTGTSLFERFNLQRQLDQIHSREVSLPSGGRLVIDPTEALTAIDINSGRSGGKNNFEDMAYRTNMEAAKMIPLQLRLRDIGGQVVADFIEMRDKSHWRDVEKTLRNGMKVDRARYDVGKIGPFGLLEIVRQRLGSSAISVSTEPCPCCNGSGIRRNMEWQSQHALREILRALRVAQAQKQEGISYAVDPELALHLVNHKRRRLMEMENTYGITISIEMKRD